MGLQVSSTMRTSTFFSACLLLGLIGNTYGIRISSEAKEVTGGNLATFPFAEANVNKYLTDVDINSSNNKNVDIAEESVTNAKEFKNALSTEITAIEKRFGRQPIARQGPPRRQFLTTLLLSIFLGAFGVDWFYLSLGNNTYIILGVLKFLLNLVGVGQIWWIIDWVRILLGEFPDGLGRPLIGS